MEQLREVRLIQAEMLTLRKRIVKLRKAQEKGSDGERLLQDAYAKLNGAMGEMRGLLHHLMGKY